MESPLLKIGTMVCSVQLSGKPSHIALLKMCQQEEHFFTGIDKLFTYESIMISDFTNCNQLMAFLTFYAVKM